MPRPALAFAVLALTAALLAPGLELLTGSPLPYLLVLTVLTGFIWAAWRLRRHEFGWSWGGRAHFTALLYPLAPLGLLAALAVLLGDTDFSALEPDQLLRRLGLMFLSTWLGTLITEEGLYRGALWGLGRRAGWSPVRLVVATSLAFAAWHVAVPIIEADFKLPAAQIPVYLANVVLLGLAWGLLRQRSGSILVACTAHASWNALVYVFFGYGERIGQLGSERIALLDPERGLLGVTVNTLVVLWLVKRK